ncbi:MAG: UDP-N-acetylmuramoyl-tripeptide--D-alanyl-D-alanine ligase [Clostridia bacterium]|nr:UDP-N-acetylmuramoyl-tripeptide--D-alanyl-D-alanine ligase [Clostridia bacterium]
MKVKDIVQMTNGELVVGNEDLICSDFSRDTREIQKGDIYIGIKGERFDGSDFWKEALDNGAGAVIIQGKEITPEEKEAYADKTIVMVENTLQALHKIAEYKRSLYNIPVVAITGSVGKTSTKDIIANVVKMKYKTLKTEGNRNNNIGLPFTILGLKDHEAMVIEMGMNHLGEIDLLTRIAKPTLAVITNIGTSHIGNLGSRENILKAKLEILNGMEEPKIVINNDNDLLHNWYETNKSNIEIHTYGIQNRSEVMAKEINLKQESSTFIAEEKDEKTEITVPVGGEHFVYNALSAVKVGEILNIDSELIQQGISSFELTKKRMEIRKLENGATLINDSYNASYEAMKASIEYLAKYEANRRIAVLGDMFELGEYSIDLHTKVGEDIAQNNIDILMCTGELSKYIIEGAKKLNNKVNATMFKDKEEIYEKLKEEIKKDDVILVKASNGMKFFEICQKL